ncbi:MAG: SDR family NAD(P)-dependent oxidoreductase [Bullifex sp.]
MKTVLITGAYSPLGRAITQEFISSGYRVYGTTTNHENHDEGIETLFLDITSEEETERVLSRITELDVLVNNAGIFTLSPPDKLSLDSFESVFDVNMKGLFLATRKLLPLLKQSNGSIVNVSSMNALHPGFGGTAHYDASKGAVSAYTRSLARETGLRVNAIAPGLISRRELIGSELERHWNGHTVKQEMLDVKELSRTVLFLAESTGIYGQTLLQDNGYCLY